MPKNPFKINKDYQNKPNRNAFDLSKTNNLTFNFGELIPCYCRETLPGDTFKIDAAMGLRFMPLAFPIQTKCRAYVHFFYQRNKNLWKDFYDFINGNDKLMGKTLVPPFMNKSYNLNQNLTTGSLGDYLGLPTVSFRHVQVPTDTLDYFTGLSNIGGTIESVLGPNQMFSLFPGTSSSYERYQDLTLALEKIPLPNRAGTLSQFSYVATTGDSWQFMPFVYNPTPHLNTTIIIDFPINSFTFSLDNCRIVIFGGTANDTKILVPQCSYYSDNKNNVYTRVQFDLPYSELPQPFANIFYVVSTFTQQQISTLVPPTVIGNSLSIDDAVNTRQGSMIQRSGDIPVSALPFRCYESIYNAFYRDDRNNPRLDEHGKPIYNKYLPSDDGGVDKNEYSIHYRNWELDQFTSAVKSPQQGVAPLVGITSKGEVTFAYDGREYTFSTDTADDADTITKVNVTEDVPNAVARSIVNVATSGISINDFRNVNSYQRWLETNIRRGLKIKDQALARWGVSPSDSVLGMPEFIGGFSVDVDINTVVNTSAQGDVSLGDYAANATAFGGSKHQISHFCDDYGFIMGIVSIVPVPVYSQLMNKMWFRHEALDYYAPEFSNIGLQPVLYRELCPLECDPLDSSEDIPHPLDTFGYQRPYYDYVCDNDEAHGLFRTNLSQFLLTRQFLKPPKLDSDFLTVLPNTLNNVFTVEQRHKVLGMIHFNVTAQRPMLSYVIPSL